MKSWVRLLPLLVLVVAVRPLWAASPVFIGFDGEYGLRNSTSAQAIERGIRVALEEINGAGGVLGGRPLQLVTRDNRSVPARGLDNIRRFAAMPDLVAVIGGRFSPVVLEEIPLVHELGLPLLDAWGSADGITEHDFRPSFSFRLSLYDRIGMPAMLRHAQARGARRLGLLVPNTGWGRSNVRAFTAYRPEDPAVRLLEPVWYNWGEPDMLRHYRALVAAGADTVVLVANDLEGALLVRQMGELPASDLRPIVSHWGVTGGRMVERSGETLQRLDFSVIQTFSLMRADPAMRERVMAVARRLFGIEGVEDIESPVGFGHAYDLVHLLARALELAGSSDRAAVRDALEQVRDYHGLTGDYPRPFTPEDHNAMGPEQLFMARFRADGVIVPLSEAAVGP